MQDDEDDDCNSLIVEAFGEDRWQRASGGGGEHGQLQLFDLDDDEEQDDDHEEQDEDYDDDDEEEDGGDLFAPGRLQLDDHDEKDDDD